MFLLLPRCHKFFLPGFWRRHSRSVVTLWIVLAAALVGASAFATATEEITNAVTAGGAPEVAQAPSEVFMRGFTAISLRVGQSDLPLYVTEAIQLRPDLSGLIVTTALRATSRTERGVISPVVALIVRAAIAANPRDAVAITRAAVEVDPALRGTIVAAAIAAAPEQRTQIESGAMSYSLALLSPQHGNSGSLRNQSASLNPANVSDHRNGDGGANNVQSPENPPHPRDDAPPHPR